MLYTACALGNLLYMVSSMANYMFDQVHCKQRWNIQMYYTGNAKYLEIYCHFVSVSKSQTWPYACWLI